MKDSRFSWEASGVYEAFAARYGRAEPSAVDEVRPLAVAVPGYIELMSRYGGFTARDGLYRVHSRESQALAAILIADAFPGYRGTVTPFGFDWIGRQFALDVRDSAQHEPQVLRFEVGSGEVIRIPATLLEFHEIEAVEFASDAFSEAFFDEWMATPAGRPLSLRECVGYRVPLFLNGSDTIDNLAVIDLEVDWALGAQMLAAVQGSQR